MLIGVKRLLSRNRKKIIIVGIVIGGTYLVAYYAKQQICRLQESGAKEFLEKSKHMQHFESTERTCNQAIVTLTTNVCDEISRILNTDSILEKLRNRTEDKVKLWKNLKLVSFTRLTTLIYATTILVITLRVQLNVLGGYLYKDTRFEEAKISDDLRQSYLSLVQNFLHNGLRKMSKLIESKIESILKMYPLTRKLSLSDIEQMFWSIQMAVNNDSADPNGNLACYVFPNKIDNSDTTLIRMYNETLDILESDDIACLCTNNVSRGFSIAVDNIAEYFTDSTSKDLMQSVYINKNISDTKQTQVDININNLVLPLAKIIPIISGITSRSYETDSDKQSLVTSLITFFLSAEKIKTMGANVYEVFSV